MSVPAIYDDGLISVTNGATAFTGTGTAWSTQLKRGSEIQVGATVMKVASIEGDGAGTFLKAWPGTSAAGVAYYATTWTDGAEIAEAIRLLIERLIGKGLGVVSAGSPVAADYRDNDLVYDRALGLLSIKDAGVLKALLAPGNYDAYGSAAGLGDFDDEAQYFTYFADDEGGFYYKKTAASADWSDLVVVRGATAEEVLAELGVGHITISTDPPSGGGSDNDLWFQVGA